MKNLQKWFTLVELIVVITILAILGTIAFISLQGYSADARNSKRTSDLSSLQSVMTVKVTEGMSIMSFVGTDDNGNELASVSIAWSGSVAPGNDYQAGSANFTALGAKQSDFQDPKNDKNYALGVTTFKGGKYQLAASIEDDAGSNKARVVGTYNKRDGAAVTPSSTGATSFTLGSADIGKFFVNDTLSGATAKVTKISADGLTVTYSGTTPTAYALNSAESDGLIGEVGTGNSIVVENSTTLLPY